MSAGIPVLGSVTLSGATSIIRKEKDYVYEHQVAGKDGGLVERVGSASTRWEIKGFLYELNADSQYQSLLALLGTSNNLSIPTFGSGYFFAASGLVFVESFGGNWIPGYGYPRYDYTLKLVSIDKNQPAATKAGLALISTTTAFPSIPGTATSLGSLIAGDWIVCVGGASNNISGLVQFSSNHGESFVTDNSDQTNANATVVVGHFITTLSTTYTITSSCGANNDNMCAYYVLRNVTKLDQASTAHAGASPLTVSNSVTSAFYASVCSTKLVAGGLLTMSMTPGTFDGEDHANTGFDSGNGVGRPSSNSVTWTNTDGTTEISVAIGGYS